MDVVTLATDDLLNDPVLLKLKVVPANEETRALFRHTLQWTYAWLQLDGFYFRYPKYRMIRDHLKANPQDGDTFSICVFIFFPKLPRPMCSNHSLAKLDKLLARFDLDIDIRDSLPYFIVDVVLHVFILVLGVGGRWQ